MVLTLYFLFLGEQIGNIPALVKLLQAYFIKGSSWIVANNQLEPILGIFQKLVSSKINDHHAFELLTTIIETVPMYRLHICICLEMGPFSMQTTKTCIIFLDQNRNILGVYMKHVLVLLLTRLQNHKTDKFKRGFVNFSYYYMALEKEGTGPDAYWDLYETVQAGLFVTFLKSIWLTEAQKVSGRIERKTCAVALIRLLTGCKKVTEGTNFDAVW